MFRDSVRWFGVVVLLGLSQVWIAITVLLILNWSVRPELVVPNSVLLFFSIALVATSVYTLVSVGMWRGSLKYLGILITVVLAYVAVICYGRDIACSVLVDVKPHPASTRLTFEGLLTILAVMYAFAVDRLVARVLVVRRGWADR